jgi:hypothetical protein
MAHQVQLAAAAAAKATSKPSAAQRQLQGAAHTPRPPIKRCPRPAPLLALEVVRDAADPTNIKSEQQR